MSNSGLVDYIKLSPKCTSGRNHAIDTVSIHCMAGQLSVETCGEVFQNREASSNYGIGPDGRIGLYVDEADRSWCTSNAENDNRAVTIEVASDSTDPYAVTDAAYDALIDLLVDICQRNGIDQLRWRGDKDLIGQVDKQNMTVHRWFSSKACPGDYLYNRHTSIANAVNAKMGAPAIPPLDSSQTEGAVSGSTSTGDVVTQGVTQSLSPNSTLVTYTNRVGTSSCTIRSGNVECITIHIARKRGDVNVLAKFINSSSKTYNYGIDIEGTIGLFADEPYMTNATGNKANDDRTINIICMNDKLSPNYTITDATYSSLVALCADICRRNYINELKYTNKPKKDTLTFHSQFAKIDCPGPYITKRITKLVKDVNNKIYEEWSKSQARIAMSNESALYVQSGIDLDAIKPYVAAPDKKQVGLNYSKMRNAGVIGVFLDAGAKLDTKQQEKSYPPTNLYTQVEEVKKAKLPFGFYFTTHAKTLDDVRKEARALRPIIYKYPPKLGMWLRCDLDTTKAMASTIVEKFYSTFIDWGLKSKCGLYATKDQAALIGWPHQATYMPLWLEGEMTDAVCPDEEMLTPSFFKLGDLTNKGYKKGDMVYDPYPAGAFIPGSTSGAVGSTTSSGQVVVGTVETKVYADYTEVICPPAPKYTGFKKYESYKAITNTSSTAYQVSHSSEAVTDQNGFRRINGYYIVAVGTGVTKCDKAGGYVDVILENGTVIPCIVGDIKADIHTDAATGHIYTSVNDTWCCSEFIVDPSLMTSDAGKKVKTTGNCSYLDSSWDSPVVKFKVYDESYL